MKKKLIAEFTEHSKEFDKADSWILLRSTSVASLLALTMPVGLKFIYYLKVSKLRENFIQNHAIEFGCSLSKRMHPLCPDASAEAKLFAASDIYLSGISDKIGISYFLPYLLLFIGVGLLIGLLQVRQRHHQNQQNMQFQQRTAQFSNLAELKAEAKKNKASYGYYHRRAKALRTEHPEFLCEPDSKKLLSMPPIVCSDGYVRGYYQFKRMLKLKENSPFTGKPLAPYGIIDIVLMGNLLAHIGIKQQNLPIESIMIYHPYSRLRVLLKPVMNVIQDLLNGLLFASKRVGVVALMPFTILSGLIYHCESNNKKFYFLSFDGKPGEDYVSSLPAIIGFSLAAAIYHRSDEITHALRAWFNRKIQQANTVEDIDNLSMPGIERKVPDIFMCPITHELLKEPVICEDRRVYERQAITQFFEGQVIKKSPINRTLIFKNAYPLLWPYTQRQQQVQQFKRKNLLREGWSSIPVMPQP